MTNQRFSCFKDSENGQKVTKTEQITILSFTNYNKKIKTEKKK